MITKTGCFIIIFTSLLFYYAKAEDYKPDKVTPFDLEKLLKFENELYGLSQKNHYENEFENIFNFIWAHRSIRIVPLLERMSLDVVAFGGGRNIQGAMYSPNADYNLNPYAYVGLQAQLKIIDPKEAREKQELILKQRADIVRILKDFQRAKTDLEHSSAKLEILGLKENRLKIRVYNAMSNFDERIANLEAIHAERQRNDALKLDVDSLESRILDLVEDNYRMELKLKLREQIQ